MTLDRAELRRRARAWGVETSWIDVRRRRHPVPETTLEAILAVLGGLAAPHPSVEGPLVLHAGVARSIRGLSGVLVTEEGAELPVRGRLPAEVAPGYHRLLRPDGSERCVIVSPGRCHLPAGLRTWGWAAQLYSVRSSQSWGMGDYGDLAALGAWSRQLGAGTLLVNPLHFSTPVPPVEPSPYSPSSRRFRDPLYLRIAGVPGASAMAAELAPLQRAGLSLNAARLIDRDAVLALKLEALSRLWQRFDAASPEFAAWRLDQGPDLEAFGVFCALSEVHGADWREWPADLRQRSSPAVARAAASLGDRAGFHVWLQWLVDRQLLAAGREVPLLHDLAIGVAPGGADTWLWPGEVAGGVHVGAPPDLFNTLGQDWGIVPFDPWRLRAASYGPFVATMRACLRGAGGLRIDHVMGLSRLYWIPAGATAAEGAYVRYPAADLFDVLALESVRAEALVVGEDLGTVEPAVREAMSAHDVLSYRLLWFEEVPPREYPERALAAVSTHDLPTVAGVWTGADLRAQEEAGTQPDIASNAGLRAKLVQLTGLPGDAPVEEVVAAAYRALAEGPSAVLLATLEDALALEARPNMPGTTPDRWPSWRMPLPASLEELRELALPRTIAGLLAHR